MLDKLFKALRRTPPTIDVKSYDKPQLSFTCSETLKMKVQGAIARMPTGRTYPIQVVVWTYQEDKQLYWGELVNKDLEDTLQRYFPLEGKP